ncbi:DUF6882 domain-containing protein [Corallococcus llansteffanensis]|uniref:Uncharacterized protein n=1 Tax=Corallococcus llansteffanensis TaxID=2316731 RepID=A0A3A8QK17_9BACT|nr:DUF6882 domain-containing protein [Corallococcus llansteffanensis]RKH68917.1 hypothetical protein D7V93_00690 [Corallococcus llansteffanensis]
MELSHLFEQHVFTSLEKQHKLFRMTGSSAWGMDLQAGQLSFQGTPYQFQVSLLGTQSDSSGTWLWAWANDALNAPRRVVDAAYGLQGYGEDHGIELLTERSFEVRRADGYVLSLLAVGLHDYSAFYRCPYPGGAAFIVLDDSRIDEKPGFDLLGLSTQVTNIMKFYEFNHRNALMAYLTARELKHSVEGEEVRFQLAEGDEGVASFDAAGRLTRLTGKALGGHGS